MTMVLPSPPSIFKSYTQTIPDPERRLFDFLIRKLKPKPAYESE
jgi:hypothetical protein